MLINRNHYQLTSCVKLSRLARKVNKGSHVNAAFKLKVNSMNRFNAFFELAAKCDHAGVVMTRIGLVIVLVWIGSLKAFRYEDEGIVPFVANSPFMSFFLPPAGR